jgi:phosphate starvation-inducible PhoH-like protein
VQEILDEIQDVTFTFLTSHDVVRHKLVGRIVAAYDTYEATREIDVDTRRSGSHRP